MGQVNISAEERAPVAIDNISVTKVKDMIIQVYVWQTLPLSSVNHEF